MNPIKYKGQIVITTKLLAAVYGATTKQIKQNFNNHKDNFTEGIHYFHLQGENLRDFKSSLAAVTLANGEVDNIDLVSSNVNTLYLWTERGANRHCKILDTDKAWEQFDNLEEAYFRARQATLPGNISSHIKYLNGVANYLRTQRQIMKDKGCSPFEIAQMDKITCDTYGIPVPECLTTPVPYQMNFLDSELSLSLAAEIIEE